MIRSARFALPVLALICGTAAGFDSEPARTALALPLSGALAAAGLALGDRVGRVVAAFALGLMISWGAPELAARPPAIIETDRPVLVAGELTRSWRRDAYGWRSRLRVTHVRQGRTVALWKREISIALSGAAGPPSSTEIRARGYLRRHHRLLNSLDSPRGAWTLRIKSPRFVEARAGPGLFFLTAPVEHVRRSLDRNLLELPDARSREVVEALVLGRSEALGRAVRQQLRRFGLSHLFAVSGLHVALVAGLAFPIARRLPTVPGTLLILATLVSYTLLTGARPATVRAALMAASSLLSLSLRRPTSAFHGLSVAVAIMVVSSPAVVSDFGFQLSASATAGILVLGPELHRRWARLPHHLSIALGASVGAQLGSSPWAWSRFGLLYPAAPLLNLVAIPWLAVLLVTAFGWTVLSLIDSRTSLITGPVLEILTRPLGFLPAFPPTPLLTWPVDLDFLSALLAAAALVATLLLRAPRLLRLGTALLFLLIVRGPASGPNAEFTMFDVGQGDALLLRDGPRAMMIDAGGWLEGDIASATLLRSLASQGVRSLDGVFLTHGDIDHCGGLLDLQAYIPIGAIMTAGALDGGRCVRSLSSGRRRRIRFVQVGESFELGRWTIRVLHPPWGRRLRGNEGSLVVKVEGLGQALLLTGDIEAGTERELRQRFGTELRARILKVSHHGSDTSSGAEFIAAVSPSLALISAGPGNRYGHPSEKVVKRLRRAGARVLRTDRDGMISLQFENDGRVVIQTRGPR